MSMLIYLLASLVMALIVLGGLVLVMRGSAADDAMDDAIKAKRELDADRKEFEQKETKETKDSKASLSSFPSVEKKEWWGAEL